MEEAEAVYHIIYSSLAIDRLSQFKLLELLNQSRISNTEKGLTGMLLYRDGTYLQFVEGAHEKVVALLKVIRNDPRHGFLNVLQEGTLPARMFPDWSMAYKNLSGLRSSRLPGYSERLQASSIAPEKKDPAQMLIDMFQEILDAPILQSIRPRTTAVT